MNIHWFVNIHWFEWIGTALTVLGSIMLSFRNPNAFVVWLASDLCWGVFAIHESIWGLFALQCFFVVTNVVCYIRFYENTKGYSTRW